MMLDLSAPLLLGKIEIEEQSVNSSMNKSVGSKDLEGFFRFYLMMETGPNSIVYIDRNLSFWNELER